VKLRFPPQYLFNFDFKPIVHHHQAGGFVRLREIKTGLNRVVFLGMFSNGRSIFQLDIPAIGVFIRNHRITLHKSSDFIIRERAAGALQHTAVRPI
jgi:hypothetical protein